MTEDSGWVVGDQGTILRTTDGGDTWRLWQSHYKVNDLLAVSFYKDLGWAVGKKGTVLHTEDGGVSWHQQPSSVETDLYGVYFLDDQHGWTVGAKGTILRTEDGGKTWKQWISQIPVILPDLHDVVFVNKKQGWVAGNTGLILYTEDGGENWKTQESGVREDLLGIDFPQPKPYSGWSIGETGTILFTQDTGQNWKQQESGTKASLEDVVFINNKIGWVVGGKGTILHTETSGNTWEPRISGTDLTLNGVDFLDSRHGWAVGDRGTILKYTSLVPPPTPTPTVEPTAAITPLPTATPTPRPSTTHPPSPTMTPTVRPTATPTVRPTATPTAQPTATPDPSPMAPILCVRPGGGGGCYATIQAAIAAAANGDTIEVHEGIYTITAGTQLIINKSITLRSAPGETTRPKIKTDYQNWNNCAVQIAADNVVLDGFEIDNTRSNPRTGYIVGDYNSAKNGWTVRNCEIHDGDQGIRLMGNNVTIANNNIHETAGDCIDAEYGACIGLKVTGNWLHSHHPDSGRKPAGLTYNVSSAGTATVEITYNYCWACRTFIDFQNNGGLSPSYDVLVAHNTVDWWIGDLPDPIQGTELAQQMSIAWWAGSGNWNGPRFIIRDNIFSRQKWYMIVDTDSLMQGTVNVQNCLFWKWYLRNDWWPTYKYPYEWPEERGAVGWNNAPTDFAMNDCITSDPMFIATGTTPDEYYALRYGSPALLGASDGTNIGANQQIPDPPQATPTPNATAIVTPSADRYPDRPANGDSDDRTDHDTRAADRDTDGRRSHSAPLPFPGQYSTGQDGDRFRLPLFKCFSRSCYRWKLFGECS